MENYNRVEKEIWAIYYFLNDKLHRTDGPAIKYYSGYKKWFYEGKRIKCNSQKEFERIIKLKSFW